MLVTLAGRRTVMTLKEELARVERGFWTGGVDYFRAHTAETCLLAFPQMAGTFSREEVAATARDPLRWKELETDERAFLQPTGDAALIAYEARAIRGNGERYRALVSTLYVRRGDGWKMAFHGQTPLGTEAG
jgi:hypothetical protein